MKVPWFHGYIEVAAWLSSDTLLAVGWCTGTADTPAISFQQDSGTVPLDGRWISYSRPDLPNRPHPVGKVIVIRFPGLSAGRPLRGKIAIDGGGVKFAATAKALDAITKDPFTAIRSSVGWMDSKSRAEVADFLVATLRQPSDYAGELAGNLRTIRDALRDVWREPLAVHAKINRMELDHVHRIDERSFYLGGWLTDALSNGSRLIAVSPEGSRTELGDRAFRYPRLDVARHHGDAVASTGFIAYTELEDPSFLRDGWFLQMVGINGPECESAGPSAVAGRRATRDKILADIERAPWWSTELLEQHTFPALNRLQELDGREATVQEVIDFGTPPRAPEISLVIPLYGQVDFLEQQVAQFADDPEVGHVELVYVLDSPDLRDELRYRAHQIHALYGLPFRVVFLQRAAGFALANNLAISLTRGRLLLLVNSDVLPTAPGWIGRMAHFYGATPRIGALGPKLLFEDGSIQHAGLYFCRPPGVPVWENRHYYKGFHRSLPAANVARRVPAVTGACLMIARELYIRNGGLRGQFVQGDYEDSDLCLRLDAAGYENWYLADVELHHLEGQSYRWERRLLTSRYNAWLHSYLWNDTIEAVMARFTPPRGAYSGG